MKLILTTLFAFNGIICFSQQFSFIELTDMINDQKLYETNNITEGNSIINVRRYHSYSYTANDGTMWSSGEYPTEYEDNFESLKKYTSIQLDFAENYDKEREVASTWYYLRIRQDIEHLIISIDENIEFPSRKLKVYFVNAIDYSSIVRQVNEYSTYIGIKEKYGSYLSEYEYNGPIIRLSKSDDEQGGGTIEIIKGDFPW